MATGRRVRFVVSYGLLIATALLLMSCAYLRTPNDPPKDVQQKYWFEPNKPVANHPGVNKATLQGLASVLAGQAPVAPATPPRPLNILSLSAGGKYAAFSAGVLTGWTAHGDRPTFDVVTGVSAGAIVAMYAFLGPAYDDKLAKFFTETNQRDLFQTRPFINLALYGSLSTPTGFKRILEQEVNEKTLSEIRAAHSAGRRFFLATMNVHKKQETVWDIGAIASCGRPDAGELVRQIFLAATAVPGMLPPVAFDVTVDGVHYTELHADGGPVTQTFVRFGPCAVPNPGTKWLSGSQLYCLAAGKIDPDPIVGRLSIVGRVGGSFSAALYALYRAEIQNLYTLCVTSGMQYNLASIPHEMDVDVVSTRVRASEMKPLYDIGYRMASAGMVWRQVPPGIADTEEVPPRDGLQFQTRPRE
jgi:hypothetical protein